MNPDVDTQGAPPTSRYAPIATHHGETTSSTKRASPLLRMSAGSGGGAGLQMLSHDMPSNITSQHVHDQWLYQQWFRGVQGAPSLELIARVRRRQEQEEQGMEGVYGVNIGGGGGNSGGGCMV